MGTDLRFHAGSRELAYTLTAAVLLLGCGGGGDTGGTAWSPPETGSATSSASMGTGGEESGAPGETSSTSSGGEDCNATSSECEGSEDSGTGDPTTGDSGDPASEVCYPGEDGSYSTCFELVRFDSLPEGYTYPAPLNGQASYRKPIALIDLQGLDPETRLAPNFRLAELAQPDQGRYAILQLHAVESLQSLRDALGSLNVSSGYRPPSMDVGTEGGEPYSRHMYGDGFDLVPTAASLADLEAACTGNGGFLIEYASHAHCDFRNDPLDVGFFGAAAGPVSPTGPDASASFGADIVEHSGVFSTTWRGFDEGEPMHRWSAYDEDGALLLRATGASFIAPAAAASVTVLVGARIELSAALGSR